MSGSFSAPVKTELCAVANRSEHCMKSELSGLVLTCGSISLGQGGLSLLLTTEHKDVVTRAISLFRKLYQAECELSSRVSQLKKTQTYSVRVTGRQMVLSIMDELGISFGLGINIDERKFSRLTHRGC
ncbi:MAG: DNA-binding protein WhiA, partial [Christensenellaceae bacterium]|nr:DNA-binding protein WhiA [Christensenellaceae bacterium]